MFGEMIDKLLWHKLLKGLIQPHGLIGFFQKALFTVVVSNNRLRNNAGSGPGNTLGDFSLPKQQKSHNPSVEQ